MKKKVKNVFLWIIGIFFLISFILYVKEIPAPAICILIAGVLCLPPINALIKRKLYKDEAQKQKKMKNYNIMKNIAIVILFLVFMVNVPTNDIQQSGTNDNLSNVISQTNQINESSTNNLVTQQVTETNGTYEGERVDGKKQGKGKFTWKDGSVYEGEFNNDQISGQGTLTIPSKGMYAGTFLDGKKERTGNI